MSSVAQARGRTVDEIQDELLRAFPDELAAGEARMFAHGWTVGVVREGLQALAAEDGLEWSGLQDVDVTRWLRGEVYPRESLERLCRLFRCHQAQLGWPARGNEVAVSFGLASAAIARRPAVTGEVVEPASGAASSEERPDWPAWFGLALSRLVALADRWEDARSCEALQALVHGEVLMFDAVRPSGDGEREYGPSRRQVLVTLLALPVALSPTLQVGGVSEPLVRRLLAQCGTSITAAWHLLRESDLAIVEQHVSGYVLALAALAHRRSAHQQEAARLASQAYRVLQIVALHRRQFRLVEEHLRRAVHYAGIAGDVGLQASALLAAGGVALFYRDDPSGAAESHQRLLRLEARLTSLQRARLHSQLAIEMAARGDEHEAARHLGQAEGAFPLAATDDPAFARQDYSPGQFVLHRGLAHLSLARRLPAGRHREAASATFDEAQSLVGDAMADRIRVEIVNHQAATALEMRDLEAVVSHLDSGVQGARRLGSALRLHEATTTWRRAMAAWPNEPRVAALRELFADAPGLGAG